MKTITINHPSSQIKNLKIKIRDSLDELTERERKSFTDYLFKAAHVPTDFEGIKANVARTEYYLKKKDYESIYNANNNLLSGLATRINEFGVKSLAFYCLLDGVDSNDINEEKALKTLGDLYNLGLRQHQVDDICDNVKKKLSRDYRVLDLARTQMKNSGL